MNGDLLLEKIKSFDLKQTFTKQIIAYKKR